MKIKVFYNLFFLILTNLYFNKIRIKNINKEILIFYKYIIIKSKKFN
jgi:hypothetical protein